MKSAGLLGLLFFFALPSIAQNTKGDKPVSNQRQIRETKFKRSNKGGDKAKTKDIAGRRIRTKNKSSANSANANWVSISPYKNRKQKGNDQAWKGDFAGKRIKPKSKSAAAARNNVYPQQGRYSRYVARQPKGKPKVYTRTASGNYPIRQMPRENQRAWKGNIRGGAIGAPSASKPFVTGRKKNVYWGKFSKGERANTKDITGGPLRTRNFKTTPPGLVGRDTLKFFGRRPGGDRTYKGSASGGYVSTKKGERAWRGDLAGVAIRKSSGRRNEVAGKFFLPRRLSVTAKAKRENGKLSGGGYRTRSNKGGGNQPLPVRDPGIGASGIAKALGNTKGRKKSKGGGSVGGSWNNEGRAVDSRQGSPWAQKSLSFQGNYKRGELQPGFGQDGLDFSGNAKAKRKKKGGGSRSGSWNNGNVAINGRSTGFSQQGVGFSGNIKSKRPLKGGGSVSGKIWNNNQSSIPVRQGAAGSDRVSGYPGHFRKGELQPGFSEQGIGFSGNVKSRRPQKGGGSVGRNLWNNNGNSIPVRQGAAGSDKVAGYPGHFRKGELQPGFSEQGIGFSGNVKSRRPQKGGGSVGRNLWNNDGNAIPVRQGAAGSDKVAGYPGHFRKGELQPGFSEQGIGFSGNMKARRQQKGGGSVSGKLWNNNGDAIPVRQGAAGSDKVSGYPGHFRKGELQPGFSEQGIGFAGNMKAKKLKKGGGSISANPRNNNDEPIAVRTPLSDDAKAADYSGKIKLPRFWKEYIQNPNAADESIKKHRPDKTTYLVDGLQVERKQGKYEEKPEAAKGSLPGIGPNSGTIKASEFAGNLKLKRNYKHNPLSAKEALDGTPATKSSVKAGEYAHSMKMYWSYKHNPSSADNSLKTITPTRSFERAQVFAGRSRLTKSYRHNPNSSDDALKVLAPGKAYARIGDFQGNLKMKKYNGNRLHPDAQFAHNHQDNVAGERTLLTNIKLFWAKLFKKNETQPAIVKEKERKPRYDKKEQDLWKALYD